MQVIRVEDLQRLYSTETVDGTLYAIGGDLKAPYLIGDVIELTEEQTSRRLGSPVPRQGRRWVSDWEPVDDD